MPTAPLLQNNKLNGIPMTPRVSHTHTHMWLCVSANVTWEDSRLRCAHASKFGSHFSEDQTSGELHSHESSWKKRILDCVTWVGRLGSLEGSLGSLCGLLSTQRWCEDAVVQNSTKFYSKRFTWKNSRLFRAVLLDAKECWLFRCLRFFEQFLVMVVSQKRSS